MPQFSLTSCMLASVVFRGRHKQVLPLLDDSIFSSRPRCLQACPFGIFRISHATWRGIDDLSRRTE